MKINAHHNRHNNPGGYSASSQRFDTRAEAEAWGAQFPKSYKFRVCSVFTLDNETKFFALSESVLTANNITGAKNETAIKRYHAIMTKAEKIGEPIEWAAPYANSYATREAFETAIA